MKTEKVMWGHKTGEEGWVEHIISTNESVFPAARAWAIENGFDKIRIANLDLSGTWNAAEMVNI